MTKMAQWDPFCHLPCWLSSSPWTFRSPVFVPRFVYGYYLFELCLPPPTLFRSIKYIHNFKTLVHWEQHRERFLNETIQISVSIFAQIRFLTRLAVSFFVGGNWIPDRVAPGAGKLFCCVVKQRHSESVLRSPRALLQPPPVSKLQ